MSVARALPQRFGLGLLACFVVALPIGFDVELVGRITVTELAMLVTVPFAMFASRMPPVTWPIRTLAILALIWLVAQFVSDVVNETAPDNMSRGAARAGITVFLILGFFLLIADQIRNARALFLAFAVGLTVGAYFHPPELAEADVWKFGYGSGVTMLVIGAASMLATRKQRGNAAALCLGVCALNLYLGYRSMGGIAFMTCLLLLIPVFLDKRTHTFSAFQIGMAMFFLLAGAAGVIEIYARAAESGLLGVTEQEKYLQQVDERGVLLSGRSEFPVALEAVREKPLLGHGSWAVNEKYAIIFMEMSGFNVNDLPADAVDLIPTHSHLMGAWVEGGILSAIFWLYVLALLIRAIIAAIRNLELDDPVITFSLMSLAWNVLFSPYGLTNRVLSCFAIVVAATVLRLDAAKRSSEKSAPP